MNCINPLRITKNLNPSEFPEGLLVPCGKCTLCRIARRREWCLRLMHEYFYWDDTMFLTLTYNDENLYYKDARNKYDDVYLRYGFRFPSLNKKHLKDFFKRIRERIYPRKLKHYSCGEYGDETERPHYHSIIFGLGLNISDIRIIIECWPYCDWDNPSIRKGAFGTVTPDSIRYVAQYIDKKMYGLKASQEYTNKNRNPVFKVQSNGIGKQYCLDNAEQIKYMCKITLNGVTYCLPRYYINLLGLNPEKIRQKAYEKEAKDNERFIGLTYGFDEYLSLTSPEEAKQLYWALINERRQKEKNILAKRALYGKRKKL